MENLETLPESINEVILESQEASSEVPAETLPEVTLDFTPGIYAAYPALSAESSSSIPIDQIKNTWKVFLGSEEVEILFPQGAALEKIGDYLVNTGSSNITGLILDGDLDLSSYFSRWYTVVPLTSQNGQNTAYRYSAHSYITVFTPGTGNTLNSSTSYVDAKVSREPSFGYGFSKPDLIIIFCLLVIVFFQFIRSFFGRD